MSPSSPSVARRFSISSPGWYSRRWPTIRTRSASAAAATTRSASATVWASGFSTKQCLPAASTRSAIAACVGTGVATATASRSGSASSSSRSAVWRASGNAWPWRSRALVVGVAEPGQLDARQAVEVAGQVGAPVAQPDDPDPHGRVAQSRTTCGDSMPRVTPRRSTTDGAPATTAGDVQARVGGHDDRAVGALQRLVQRQVVELEVRQRGHEVVVVDQVGAAGVEHPHDLQRRRLAQVADVRACRRRR